MSESNTTPDQGDERRAEAYIAAHDAFNSALPAGLRGHSEWCDRFDAARAAFDRAFVMSHPEYAEAGKGACDHSQKEIVSYWACVECGHVPAFDSVPSSQQREPQEAAERPANFTELWELYSRVGDAHENHGRNHEKTMEARATFHAALMRALSAPQEAAEMTEEAVRLWLAQRGRMSVPRSDYLKAIAPASLREAQIQAVASAVDACEERGCKECAGMLRGEIHRLRAWDFKDSRSAPQEAGKPAWKCADRLNDCRELCGSSQCFSKEAGKGEPVADEPFGWFSAFRDGSEDFMRRTDSQPAPAYEEEPTHCIALYAHPSPQALSDEEIIDLACVVSTVNNYSNGRFASAIFEREHAIAFARAILAAAGGSEK